MQKFTLRQSRLLAGALLGSALLAACAEKDPVAAELATAQLSSRNDDDDDRDDRDERDDRDIRIGDYSVTPALARGMMPGVRVRTIIGSDDVLPGSPSFIFGGSADGAGLLQNENGTFTMLVNHEDNFSVSRVTLDRSFRPIKGEYLLNSDVGRYRLCSATLTSADEHGFGPVFLTAGESNQESQIHAVDPFGPANASKLLTAFGRWNAENAVPLPAKAYRGKTVVVIGDDDSGPFGGQVALYVSDRVGDLENGRLYAMARTDNVTREKDMVPGRRYPIQFREITNQKTMTGAQINARTGELSAIQFGRVEDVDYRKGGNGREVYFNVTGHINNGDRTKYGRVYRVEMAANDPTRGTLELLLDGDDKSATNPARLFQNVDNILVTRNYVYIQEDPNLYGDETHDAYIYQYNISKRTLRPVITLDHRRTSADAATYNVGGASAFGSWEYGAMLDITDKVGGHGERGTFLLALQPHTWRGTKYRAPDGGTLRANENQASQMVVVTGLPR